MSDFDAIRRIALPVMDLFCSFSSIFFCVHSSFQKNRDVVFIVYANGGEHWWDTEPKSWKTTMVESWINTRNGESPKLKPKWIMDLKDSRLRKLQEMGFYREIRHCQYWLGLEKRALLDGMGHNVATLLSLCDMHSLMFVLLSEAWKINDTWMKYTLFIIMSQA